MLLLPSLLVLATAAGGLWMWQNLCLFPLHGWNEIRLAPTFMWAHGISPYPAAAAGPATTWIYGPVPLLLNLPATLASDTSGALLIAGTVNLVMTLVAISVTCAGWPAPSTVRRTTGRWVAVIVCLALWPTSSLIFIQPDNTAIALNLLAMHCLVRAPTPTVRWLAAAATAAALCCKQTMLGFVVAQCVYLALRHDLRAAGSQLLRIASLTTLLGCLAAIVFGLEGFWFHVVVLPAQIPWVESLVSRFQETWPQLAVHVALPLAVLAACGRRVLRRDSWWLLPALAWITAWPLDLVSLFKNGGSVNSLHAFLLFLPPAATLLANSAVPTIRLRRTMLAALGLAMLTVRLIAAPVWTWRPVIRPLHQAESLARQLPGEVFFPWHPLVSFYADRRFYHVEDGFFIRYLTQHPLPAAAISAYLPPRMHVMAFRRNELEWGIARSLIPPGAQVSDFGAWTLYSWLSEPPAVRLRSSPHS